MSIQFGRWNFDGKPVDRAYIESVKPILAPYGPDNSGSYSRNGISILYGAFHTTKESRREAQPFIIPSGSVLTWDGRLDNRDDLIHELRNVLDPQSTDVEIVAAAYQLWGSDSFAALLGDWALSIWNPTQRSLILATDPIGTRHLFYFLGENQVTWSTILDPLIMFSGQSFELSEEYIAGWFSSFPATDLTPYVGIASVQPSTSVSIGPGKRTIRKYWEFNPDRQVRYRTDGEYEEHFRSAFGEAVRRRLRSDNPILAELSGGMDSSSIVCMADAIVARGAAKTPRLDTISYFDDSEPNWNERPYFARVEEKRGRIGHHIDVSSQEWFKFDFDRDYFAPTPYSAGGPSDCSRQLAACLASQENRVILSGIGGDEVTGGAPTPVPELQDLLARGDWRTLSRQLTVWALHKREPLLHLFCETGRSFFPPGLFGVPSHRRPASWLNPGFVKRNRAAFRGQSRIHLFGPRPSFQANLSALDGLQRQLMCSELSSRPAYEKRYPYLDRDFLEFMYAVPRAQLLRPGQRRSLMRRALVDIVPDELLNRKRKAFVSRAPLKAISTEWSRVTDMTRDMISDSIGIVDSRGLLESFEKARQGNEVPTIPLLRALALEAWFRHRKTRIAAPRQNEENERSSNRQTPTYPDIKRAIQTK